MRPGTSSSPASAIEGDARNCEPAPVVARLGSRSVASNARVGFATATSRSRSAFGLSTARADDPPAVASIRRARADRPAEHRDHRAEGARSLRARGRRAPAGNIEDGRARHPSRRPLPRGRRARRQRSRDRADALSPPRHRLLPRASISRSAKARVEELPSSSSEVKERNTCFVVQNLWLGIAAGRGHRGQRQAARSRSSAPRSRRRTWSRHRHHPRRRDRPGSRSDRAPRPLRRSRLRRHRMVGERSASSTTTPATSSATAPSPSSRRSSSSSRSPTTPSSPTSASAAR